MVQPAPTSAPASAPSPPSSPSPSPEPPTWRPYRPPPGQTTTSNNNNNNNINIDQEPPLDPSILPTGSKSLSGISLRAFLIGTTFGLTTALTLLTTTSNPLYTPLWRIPFFLSSLSLFHFLEYYITAAYNTRFATTSAYLLSSNGWTYHIAHASAITECLLTNYFSPTPLVLTPRLITAQVTLGLILMIVGQTVRSVAMAQAGSNFNHTVQVKRREGHILVTGGLYSVFRHPSYFGFFWWGLGTQLVLGNVFCLGAYALVLWRFFASRIDREERFLVAFFGKEYEDYRKRSWVGIPGIH
ncbi:protein-S-isoprenylcysteine carboxyl O-methyltransferase [Aspergillus ibericus CBS 121593]|uniref:Protein-S-isoprenylcysteine O-methyltransferase n=1 Tax=Aspergillus ibericus CBS 121593 TaxID=1448316 RepID=A0A395H3H6_9EURO|nr:ICMT-domain-containing protein [Aspergillus ibericus CBS 121593]RAL02286.1 ICMT-domain-containing protein [Aspergillus ibericus CBS 121593]